MTLFEKFTSHEIALSKFKVIFPIEPAVICFFACQLAWREWAPPILFGCLKYCKTDSSEGGIIIL